MVSFVPARDALMGRLEAVFGPAWEELAPGVQQPRTYLGFPPNEPPFYVAVDEIVDLASTGGAATMGHARIDFTLRVWCFARHSSLRVASDTLMAYVGAVFEAVLADQRLGFAVDNSFPRLESAGTSVDGSKYHVAAAAIAVECHVFSQCPADLMEVVAAANASEVAHGNGGH